MDLFQLGFENLPPIKTILQLVFYLMLGTFAIFTAVLFYHWNNYALEKSVSRVTLLAYFISTIPLLAIMGGILLIV